MATPWDAFRPVCALPFPDSSVSHPTPVGLPYPSLSPNSPTPEMQRTRVLSPQARSSTINQGEGQTKE